MMRLETDTPPADGSRLQVLHVLLLLQAAGGLLAGLAMLLFSGGNPLALPLTIGGPLSLFVLAAGVARSWRWAVRVTRWLQYLILLGFALSAAVALLPQVAFSVSLLGLITNVGLPVTVLRLLPPVNRAAEAKDEAATAATASAAA